MTKRRPKKTQAEHMLESMRALQKGEIDEFMGLRIERMPPKKLTPEEEREARELLGRLEEAAKH